MYVLNLDKNTFRILSVGKVSEGISIQNGVALKKIPDIKVFHDYRYINSEFVYDPVVKESEVSTQSLDNTTKPIVNTSLEDRVATLESKIDKLTSLVETLVSNK